MQKSNKLILVLIVFLALIAIAYYMMPKVALAPAISGNTDVSSSTVQSLAPLQNIPKTEEDWKKILTPDQYHILREKGTEAPFSSPLDKETRPGTYYTADCHQPVFRSEQKYDSGTGWPSFWQPISPDVVVLQKDDSIPFEERTEVLSKCGGHLGHVFNDGPQPTGLRYCMDGLALIFVPDAPK